MEGELERMRDPALLQPRVVELHLPVTRPLRRAARALARASFPRERLLVIPSEDLLERPGETYGQVLDFLGAPPHELESYPRVFVREYADMDPQTRSDCAATTPSRTGACTSSSAATSAGASSFMAASIAAPTVAESLGDVSVTTFGFVPVLPTKIVGVTLTTSATPAGHAALPVLDRLRVAFRREAGSRRAPGMLAAADVIRSSLSQPVFSGPWLSYISCMKLKSLFCMPAARSAARPPSASPWPMKAIRANLHLQLSLAHVVRDDGRHRQGLELLAEGALQVDVLDHGHRSRRVAEHGVVLRNPGRTSAGRTAASASLRRRACSCPNCRWSARHRGRCR